MTGQPLALRLRLRAQIRRSISTRKSVQEGKPDRIADLLEEAADALDAKDALLDRAHADNEHLRNALSDLNWRLSADRQGGA